MNFDKRYLVGSVVVALILARCTQLALERSAVEEKIAAGGFESAYEMQDINELGFKSKDEYERFIRGNPIASAEAEIAVKCSALASVWEERQLSQKRGLVSLVPATIGSVLYESLGSYSVGKTTYKVLSDRRAYLLGLFETELEKSGSGSIQGAYLSCHTQFAAFVVEKCGNSGVCEDSTELLGLDGKPLSGATESEESPPTASSDATISQLPYEEKNCELISALSESNAKERIARKLEVSISSISFLGPKWDYSKYSMSGKRDTCYLQFDTPEGPIDCQLRENDILTDDRGRTAYGDLFHEDLCYK